MEATPEKLDKRTAFLALGLEAVASQNGTAGEECIVPDSVFVKTYATPDVISAALEPFGDLRQKLMNKVLTALNQQTPVTLPLKAYARYGSPFVASTIVTTLDDEGIKPSVVRDALSPSEWAEILPAEIAWRIMSHGKWWTNHPVAFIRFLNGIDSLKILTWDEKEDAVGIPELAKVLPQDSLARYFMLAEISRRTGRPMDPNKIHDLVSNETLVQSIQPNTVWEIPRAAAQKLGIPSEDGATKTNADAADRQTTKRGIPQPAVADRFSAFEAGTSPGLPPSTSPRDGAAHKNGNGNGPVVVRESDKPGKPDGSYSVSGAGADVVRNPPEKRAVPLAIEEGDIEEPPPESALQKPVGSAAAADPSAAPEKRPPIPVRPESGAEPTRSPRTGAARGSSKP